MKEDTDTLYKLKWSLEETLRTIKDTTIYLHELAEKGDVNGLNLYRIFLNNKVMESVKLKKKIINASKR
jgi:hypothetical protein